MRHVHALARFARRKHTPPLDGLQIARAIAFEGDPSCDSLRRGRERALVDSFGRDDDEKRPRTGEKKSRSRSFTSFRMTHGEAEKWC
jgi:hypothetical protein